MTALRRLADKRGYDTVTSEIGATTQLDKLKR